MTVRLLANPELIDRCKHAAYTWARENHEGRGWRETLTAAEGYTTMVRKAIVAGRVIPVEPSDSQTAKGLTVQDAEQLRELLMANIEAFLIEVADDLRRVAPVFSPAAADALGL